MSSTQNVTARYLKKPKLQKLLEKLFPGYKDFNIEVSYFPDPNVPMDDDMHQTI